MQCVEATLGQNSFVAVLDRDFLLINVADFVATGGSLAGERAPQNPPSVAPSDLPRPPTPPPPPARRRAHAPSAPPAASASAVRPPKPTRPMARRSQSKSQTAYAPRWYAEESAREAQGLRRRRFGLRSAAAFPKGLRRAAHGPASTLVICKTPLFPFPI
ncbi:unnamed protein product [Symbiodinium natans]|uniref:Uncharacterized protein n=1 Tax=Symbiodinium natans TaxID=878477 RepID=A0A812T5P6_9DINO|nr:unnamed protein product [Symbiodinium natans]